VLDFNGSQRSVPVQTGVVGDDRTQVVSGLTVGAEVVVGGRCPAVVSRRSRRA
jgi:hypothetical protein